MAASMASIIPMLASSAGSSGGATGASSPASPTGMSGLGQVAGGVQAVGSIVSTIGGMFKAEPEKNGALPFEIEKQMILDSQRNLTTIQQNIERSRKVYDSYVQQYKTLQRIQKSALPSADDMKALSQSNIEIAKAFGGNTLEAIKQGFLDEDTARISGLIEGDTENLKDNLAEVLKADFKDPNLVNKQMQDRRKLQQDLVRQGANPQQVAQAMQQFDQQANNQMFSRSEELRNNRLGQFTSAFNATTQGYQAGFNTLQAGKNQNFNQAVQGYGQLQNGITSANNAVSNYNNLNTNMFNVNQNYNNGFNNNIQAQEGVYDNIAQTPLSLKTRGALGDDVSYSSGFLGLSSNDPAKDPASVNFRKQYQSAKAKRFATRT